MIDYMVRANTENNSARQKNQTREKDTAEGVDMIPVELNSVSSTKRSFLA
jgi:hypothetical protein